MIVRKQLQWKLKIPMKIQDISIIISIILRLWIVITPNLLLDSGCRAEYANSFIVYLYTLSIFNKYPTKKNAPH